MKQHRSVLKRYERLRILKEKGEWEDEDSVFGLPKVKIVRFKIKKEKAAEAEAPAAAAAPGAAPQEAAPSTQPEAKETKPKK
jgi:small basic protein (TIGR04137 family)